MYVQAVTGCKPHRAIPTGSRPLRPTRGVRLTGSDASAVYPDAQDHRWCCCPVRARTADARRCTTTHHTYTVPRFSITVPDNLVQAYERVDDLEAEVEELRERLDSRADRIDQLEEQLARRSQVEGKVDILAERVEDRERAADAPFFVRWARWFRSDDG